MGPDTIGASNVVAWSACGGSNTLETDFYVATAEEAPGKGRPVIFNTDKGSQFTGEAFTGLLGPHSARISMDVPITSGWNGSGTR